MKFPKIWFWTVWKGVAGSQWHWRLLAFGLEVMFWHWFWYTNSSCSVHVPKLCIWTLKHEQQNHIDHLCVFAEFGSSAFFVGGCCLEHDLDALWSLLGSGFSTFGRTVRRTYVRPAGPPCLWPDRPSTLELTKLLNGGKGCSRRKHRYRKESGSRALLAFPLQLALYAWVLSKPGELCIPCLGTDEVWRFLRWRCFACSVGFS